MLTPSLTQLLWARLPTADGSASLSAYFANAAFLLKACRRPLLHLLPRCVLQAAIVGLVSALDLVSAAGECTTLFVLLPSAVIFAGLNFVLSCGPTLVSLLPLSQEQANINPLCFIFILFFLNLFCFVLL